MQAAILKTVCVNTIRHLSGKINVKEFLQKRFTFVTFRLYSLIKFIHKTFTCLQIEMYLISFTKANYSHATSTDKSVLQRKPFAFVMVFLWKIALFTTNKSVYETEHWRESPRIVIYAYNESGHGRHRNIQTSWMELIYNRLSSKRSNCWFD